MNASIHQLRCLIEVERTRSVSQAAANLYIGQPNLSRTIKDIETSMGFPIFERTRKGVRPTEKGVAFLKHARNILREVDYMESLGLGGKHPNRFRICIPRSYEYMEMTQRFLSSTDQPIDGEIRECHPRCALEMIENGKVEISVIRYSMQYQDYFTEQTQALKLVMQPLQQVSFQAVVKASAQTARCNGITRAQLDEMTEITHRDVFYPQNEKERERRRIYTVDRMAQLQLLQNLPDSYLLCEPLPKGYLSRFGLAQLPCDGENLCYQDAALYKPQCVLSEPESAFLTMLKRKK